MVVEMGLVVGKPLSKSIRAWTAGCESAVWTSKSKSAWLGMTSDDGSKTAVTW